jgi:hypothetical protein
MRKWATKVIHVPLEFWPVTHRRRFQRCSDARLRHVDVAGRIIKDLRGGPPFTNDVGGEQTLNIGKASKITQKEPAFPGSPVSSVTSAHDVTR